jgi:hypothetical protein
MSKKLDSVKALVKKSVKRPGVHAKSKSSKIKTSKNYIKSYNKQGK